MTTQNSETLINEMGLALKKVEARLQNSEEKQNTTAQRLDELYKALLERLNAKEDTLASLKEHSEWTLRQNDTLLKQIGLRWNLLTGLTAFLTLAFSIVFVYQILNVESVLKTKSDLDKSAADAKASNALLEQNTKDYSDILGTLARADSLMTESNREFIRAEYTAAAKLAKDAIEVLKAALPMTGDSVADLSERTLLYASSTCSLSASAAAKISGDSDSALSPKALRGTVRDTLFTAYDLDARAAFFSTPRGDLREDGKMLLALNDSQWEGYHWIGLAAESSEFDPQEAIECFRRSVDKNPVGNKDYVNLAELSFIHSGFPEAVKYSDQYLHPLLHRFKTPVDVVAQFYFSAGGLLAHDADASENMPPETFRQKVSQMPAFSLEGTFTSNDIDRYLKTKEYSDKTTPAERQQIQSLLDCLTSRQCKN